MKITRLDPQTKQPTADSWTLSRSCRRLVVGRAAPANILLDSPGISPLHAELSWQGGSLSIRDLASINGVYLHDSRILRAALQDKDIFSVGGIPFLTAIEPSDLAARRNRLLAFAGFALGTLLLAILIFAFFLDARTAEPEAPPQEPVPILPPVVDTAFQQMSDQYAEASLLLEESRRVIADGLDDLRAAQLLGQAIALHPDLPQATLLLKGLQNAHGPDVQKQIDLLVASGRFQEALDELDRQKALVGSPNAVQETQDKISQRIQYQGALESLARGDLDAAERVLSALSPDVVPERQESLDRLAQCREAVAWAEKIGRLADRNDMEAVQRLADDESRYSPYLSEDALGEVHGALARVHALGDIQNLVATGNAYVLVQYIGDIPNLSEMLKPLRSSLSPMAGTFRQTAEVQAAQTTPGPLPVDLKDALASYETAKAFAALCIIRPDAGDLRQYRLHSKRWYAYLAAIAARAHAYIEKGAREEARAILQPVLPHLDDYDAETYSLRSLAVQIVPVPFTPETAHFLDRPPAGSSAAQ